MGKFKTANTDGENFLKNDDAAGDRLHYTAVLAQIALRDSEAVAGIDPMDTNVV